MGVGIGAFYPGVERALAVLKVSGVPMVLLTKGDGDKQQEKVRGHGLERYFDHIVITAHKEATLLQEVVQAHQLTAPVIIGASESSDIKPAQEAGYDSVLIDRGTPKWMMERHDVEAVRVRSFPEAVLGLLRPSA